MICDVFWSKPSEASASKSLNPQLLNPRVYIAFGLICSVITLDKIIYQMNKCTRVSQSWVRQEQQLNMKVQFRERTVWTQKSDLITHHTWATFVCGPRFDIPNRINDHVTWTRTVRVEFMWPIKTSVNKQWGLYWVEGIYRKEYSMCAFEGTGVFTTTSDQ